MFIKEFKELLERGEDLPTLPDVVLELQAAFEREDVAAAEVSGIVERDPALTTRLLRVANSPVFRRGDPIIDVGVAVQRMGMKNVRATCVVLGVVKSFEGTEGALDHQEFWNHSSAVGLAAQRLWRMRPACKDIREDQLYVAGLLHDVGLLVLDQFFPERMKEVGEVRELSGDLRPVSESLVLGMDHGMIGGMLLGRWSLPEVIVHSVSHHHDPDAAPESFDGVCRTIHAAECLCEELEIGMLNEASADDTDGILGDLGFGPSDTETVREEMQLIGPSARGFLAV